MDIHTTEAIASACKVTPQAVISRARVLGLRPAQSIGKAFVWSESQARKLMSKPVRGRPRKKGAAK